MDLALTEAQQMLKRLTRDLLEREYPPSLARELEQDERGHSPEVWRKMVETGLVNAAFPREYGGAGGSLTDLGVIFDEMGRGLYTGPYFATVALGGLSLLYAGTEEQRHGLIPAVAQGQALLSLALLEESGRYAPDAIRLEARARGDHFVLSGVKLFVEYANVADFILCSARTGPDNEAISLFLVPASSPGLSIAPLDAIGGDRQSEVTFDEALVPAHSVIGEVDGAWPHVRRALDVATALTCMQMAGMAEKVLERTVDYVKMRVQFGRPIGSLQAVQHHCADMAIHCDGATLAAQEAVSRLDQGLPARREIAIAKAFCSRACQFVTLTAHQLHGGVGFMQEFDLQMYTRQMQGMALRLGTADDHLEVVADELLGAPRHRDQEPIR